MTKQLARFSLAIMVTLLALIVLWQFNIVVVYVLISLMLAASLRPLMKILQGRRLPIRITLIILFLIVLVGFGFLLFLTAQTAIIEMQLLAQTVSAQDEWKLPIWLKGSAFQLSLLERLPTPSHLFDALIGDEGQLILPAILDLTQEIGSVISGILIILFLIIYWTISQVAFERLWLSLLPSNLRKQARDIWQTIEIETGAYIRNQIVRSIIAGLLLGIGYWLLGSPYPVFMALMGAFVYFVPIVGVALVVILPFLLGLTTSMQLSIITVLYTLGVLAALGLWINPWLFKRKWDNPILTVILLIVLMNALGIIGIIIAPPISVVCQILWKRLVSHRQGSREVVHISDLKERMSSIEDFVKEMEEPHLPLITSSLERLTNLLSEAEPILEGTSVVGPSPLIKEITS